MITIVDFDTDGEVMNSDVGEAINWIQTHGFDGR